VRSMGRFCSGSLSAVPCLWCLHGRLTQHDMLLLGAAPFLTSLRCRWWPPQRWIRALLLVCLFAVSTCTHLASRQAGTPTLASCQQQGLRALPLLLLCGHMQVLR
jgi:protein-S-isoprenylcysteine O-methyltransferase Ste14